MGSTNYATNPAREVVKQSILGGIQVSYWQTLNMLIGFPNLSMLWSFNPKEGSGNLNIRQICQLPHSVFVKKSPYSLTFNLYISKIKGLFFWFLSSSNVKILCFL